MGILDIIIIVLIVAWLGGFSFHIGGGLVHLLLVIAVIVLIIRLLS
jgi:hypothetical protein